MFQICITFWHCEPVTYLPRKTKQSGLVLAKENETRKTKQSAQVFLSKLCLVICCAKEKKVILQKS